MGGVYLSDKDRTMILTALRRIDSVESRDLVSEIEGYKDILLK